MNIQDADVCQQLIHPLKLTGYSYFIPYAQYDYLGNVTSVSLTDYNILLDSAHTLVFLPEILSIGDTAEVYQKFGLYYWQVEYLFSLYSHHAALGYPCVYTEEEVKFYSSKFSKGRLTECSEVTGSRPQGSGSLRWWPFDKVKCYEFGKKFKIGINWSSVSINWSWLNGGSGSGHSGTGNGGGFHFGWNSTI